MRYNPDNDCARIFEDDSREKKYIGKNIFKRAATRAGKVSSMKTPLTLMSKKEAKAYTAPGPCISYNIKELRSAVDSINFELSGKFDSDQLCELLASFMNTLTEGNYEVDISIRGISA